MSTANDNDTDDETVTIRHDGRATVWGGPADLEGTDPGDEVEVPADEADHYIEFHGFSLVESDPAPETTEEDVAEDVAEDESSEPSPTEALAEFDYRELQAAAKEVDGIPASQSEDDLREQLLEHYTDETETED